MSDSYDHQFGLSGYYQASQEDGAWFVNYYTSGCKKLGSVSGPFNYDEFAKEDAFERNIDLKRRRRE